MKSDDSPLTEWRGTEFKLEENENDTKNKEFIDLFDWDEHFYNFLLKEGIFKEN